MKHRGIEKELDKPRLLRFNFNSMIELDETLKNANYPSVLAPEFWSKFTELPPAEALKVMRAMMRAALLPEDPEITIEQAGDLISMMTLEEATGLFVDLFKLFSGGQADASPLAPKLTPAARESN